MNRISSIVSALTLSALVLLGSGGIVIGKMICGAEPCTSTDYTIGQAIDCCATENKYSEEEDCCCQLVNVTLALDDFSVSEKLNIDPSQSLIQYASALLPAAPNILCQANGITPPEYPPAEKDILRLFRVFRI